MDKPNPNCPGCEGKGEHRTTKYENGRYMECDEYIACPLCSCLHSDIYKAAETLALQYSGKASNIAADLQEEIFVGDEGKKYRRLVKWIWENPPYDKSHGDGRITDKKWRSTPFRKLFNFEPKIGKSKPKACIPVYMERNGMIFSAKVEELRKQWADVIKGTERKSVIPILRYVKVEVGQAMIEMSATDLDTWVTGSSCADNCLPGIEILIHGARLMAILRACDKKGTVSFYLDVRGEGKEAYEMLIVRHQSCTWELPTLDLDNFPHRREQNDFAQTA